MKTATKLTTLVVALVIPLMGMAQSPAYKLDKSSTMTITGTSTLHDWEANVKEMNLTVSLNPDMLNQENPASPVSSLSLSIPVKSIDSGKGGMDKRIYGALEEKDHPNVMFNLVSAEVANMGEAGESFTLNVTGQLNIAGTAKEVTFPVQGTKVAEGGYRFEGSYGLNMKDYNVDPPSAMLGAIKSGEEVEIKFNFLFLAS